jgi:osmotically-inducible protein OsmY
MKLLEAAEFAMTSDDAIRRRVKAALARDPRIDERHLCVNVHEGVVTLSGTVPHCAERRLAAEVAAGAAGVRAVANETDVKGPPEGELSDAEIAELAASILHQTFPVASQAIRIEVCQGWVTLAGQVDTSSQKAAAESALVAQPHTGIKGILNCISLRPKQTAFERHPAFWRLAGLRARGILIDFQGDAIILRGTVSSYRDRNDAAIAAWSAPGVTRVENLLVVRS